ncbi:DUF221-domain-containing protein [Aulographum hederae CBS 113979]|uniref:DUF221-domain-containing protein n=1 Tax=Aulographum hederae CBS 113979 TaxID=1176131 RepID=A0A6G1H3E3_9PEZI|nr:DUF221-domain-containing protein [Aulographum hederae CBS 113979]
MGLENQKDTWIQLSISLAFGAGAFLAFCILRPRWTGLYAARKKQKDEASSLPDLPTSLLGWMPALYRVTEQQVLVSAGLDAFVFLAFFKMAIKVLLLLLVCAFVVIKPVHDQYAPKPHKHTNGTDDDVLSIGGAARHWSPLDYESSGDKDKDDEYFSKDYLWMYLIFTYVFTGVVIYFLVAETRRIIEIRQEYLGSQSTITDRTIRLSGIPPELRSEEKIQEVIETFEIGKVESVTLCRNWKELDDLMVQRMTTLRRLEEVWTVHLGRRRVERSLETLPIAQPLPPGPVLDGDDNEDNLLLGYSNGGGHVRPYSRNRPTTRIWHGRFKLKYTIVDAIDYFEEKLRRLDDQIRQVRKKTFEPTALAFVTMDSVATCQMAIQAVLDPSPLQLQARISPAPADVVWPNTYSPRTRRMLQAWAITAVIAGLTVIWSIILVPIAGILDLGKIYKVWPQLAEFLNSSGIGSSLVQTQFTTLIISLLNVLVPYLYAWLSNMQGMISYGDVELSVIAKNFFFTFVNFFVVFTALGTAALSSWDKFGNGSFSDTTQSLAKSIQGLRKFYVNFIILQGLGLFPFRLLEFGSVALYPIYRLGAKTPRDYAELIQPPVFSYGFYLPQTILIFMICIVYSVLQSSWQVLLAGLAYFVIGYFCYKYQLLYAMDHRQHSTGKGWTMICDRIIVGLIVFQLTMAGQLALLSAVRRSLLVIPLILLTWWFSIVYGRSYKPLMEFIALRSIKRGSEQEDIAVLEEDEPTGYDGQARRVSTGERQTIDEVREGGLRFINPSLIMPLHDVWIMDKAPRAGGNHPNETANGDGALE